MTAARDNLSRRPPRKRGEVNPVRPSSRRRNAASKLGNPQLVTEVGQQGLQYRQNSTNQCATPPDFRQEGTSAEDRSPVDKEKVADRTDTLNARDVENVFAQVRPALTRYFEVWIDDPEEAEDLVQETLIYIFMNLWRLRFPTTVALRVYIFQNASGRRIDYHRRARRRTFVPLSSLGRSEAVEDGGGDALGDDDLHEAFGQGQLPTPEAHVQIREEGFMVLSVIKSLPPAQARVLSTLIQGELTEESFGTLSGPDRVNLHRARAELRRRRGDRHVSTSQRPSV